MKAFHGGLNVLNKRIARKNEEEYSGSRPVGRPERGGLIQ